MKYFYSLIISLVCAHQGLAQLDFDSLYKHNKAFKSVIKQSTEMKDFYAQEKLLEFTITADFKELIKNKNDDFYREAVLSLDLNDTVRVIRNVQIKPRGNLRKQICHFPPLKVNFKKKELHLKELKEFDKIKMVGTCRNSNAYEQYVLSEYYIYKMYNQLTDYSFRVRLLRVKYVDTGRRNKSRTRFAFFIEPVDQLATRTNTIEIEVKRVHPDRTNYELINTFSVFQYMIGNTDFSVPGLHNVKMIKSLDPLIYAPFAVPYDFDYTGIIDAHYAIPSDVLHIDSVTERLFRGFCRTKEDFQTTFDLFNLKRDNIYSLYSSSPYLNKKIKSKSLSYLDSFYETINSEYQVKREFLDRCRTTE